VVIDTSVWVAAGFRSQSRRIYELWQQGRLIVCYSPALLREYRAILCRIPPLRPFARCLLQRLQAGEATLLVEAPPPLAVAIEDPADLKFLACAVAARAPWLVSLDRHLLNLGAYDKVEVLRPTSFLQRIT
jgi:putative PIN family toxin of toxin-antitoxin system